MMPEYKTIDDLPMPIKETMPREAQEIYLNAHQRFWREEEVEEARIQNKVERVHRSAMDIVKGKYEQDEDTGYWRPREDLLEED